eukprot:2937238-Alexandrium_andersonii.AAC.1
MHHGRRGRCVSSWTRRSSSVGSFGTANVLAATGLWPAWMSAARCSSQRLSASLFSSWAPAAVSRLHSRRFT